MLAASSRASASLAAGMSGGLPLGRAVKPGSVDPGLTERRDARAAVFTLAAQAVELVPVDRGDLGLRGVVAVVAAVVTATGRAARQPAGQRQHGDARADEGGA